MSQYSDYSGYGNRPNTEQSLQNRGRRNSSLFKDIDDSTLNKTDIGSATERIARAAERQAVAQEEMAKGAEASLKKYRSAQERLEKSLDKLSASLDTINNDINDVSLDADKWEELYNNATDENEKAMYRQKKLDALKEKSDLQYKKIDIENQIRNTTTSKSNIEQRLKDGNYIDDTLKGRVNAVANSAKSFVEDPVGWVSQHGTDLIPIICSAVAAWFITGGVDQLGGIFGGEGGRGKSGSGGGNSTTSSLAASVSGLIKTVNGLLNSLFAELSRNVDTAVDVYADSMGKVNARLYGDVDKTNFKTLIDSMRTTVGSSMVVNQSSMIKNLVDLTQKGIDYNLEQRALLATLSSDLVPTFEVMNDNLERMIRLQQSDTTLAQMGAEAMLQEMLNGVFKDSSYLNNTYDSVYSAISDALSLQIDTDQSTQFGYAVQKWLGGLYSVGLSGEAVSSLANAINLLATGNIGKLNDSSAQTLLSMAATRAGMSYTSLLTEGMTADDTNKLMKSIVEYLQDIATNTSSNVMKSQWGDILNIQMSDWRAIQNLTESDISNLFNSVVTQETAQTKISNIIETELAGNRIHISEMVNNAIDNTMMSFGLGIADSTDKYVKWKLMNVAGNLATGLGGGSDTAIGSILNLFSSAATLAEFSQDILAIPQQLFSLLLRGDNAIGSVMSGYQFTMDRGNMQYSGEGASYNVSQSSDLISLGLDEEDNSIFGDIAKSLNVVVENGQITSPGALSSDVDDETISMIATSAADSTLTTLQQQDQYQSATAQNVISQESVLIRDINDLYSELFEKQSVPIRVAIAKVEDQGMADLHAAIDGITVSIEGGDDVFGAIASMRS